MAQFNLADYETVEERIARFYKDHPDGRIITENLTTKEDRQVGTWVVRAFIFFNSDGTTPAKSTGLAFEVDSNRGPQATSALEVCETSSIGRALANAGYSGNRKTTGNRPTREEMEKVERNITPAPQKRDWAKEIEALTNVDDARQLYNEARTRKAGNQVLESITAKVQSFERPTA